MANAILSEKKQTVPDVAARLAELKARHRDSDNWDGLSQLLDEMGALTGAAEWNERDFDRGILLYGAGSIGAGALDYFKRRGINVVGFLDDTPGREGGEYYGVDIMPSECARDGAHPIVISIKDWNLPALKLSAAGLRFEAFSHHVFHTNLAQLNTVARDLLVDDRSRYVLLRILKANIFADYSFYHPAFEGNQYWAIPEFQYIAPDPKGVMVDAGAYVGDTVEEFVWRTRGVFDCIHAFEPNPRLLSAMRQRAGRLQQEWALREGAIRCNQAGLGEEESGLPFFDPGVGNMAGSFLFSHGTEVGTLCVRTLDNYLAGAPVTFLKADIEGFEMPLLRGAAASVGRFAPRVAICLYHRITDLFEIPLYLKSLVPGYKMAIRHHSLSQDESVLYCWVSC
ncbi:MAG: FkbM family methyltransferase [Planctomycetia bacterium]|nr:FkbM family methyltransferase [Planctomycetia bacterium]